MLEDIRKHHQAEPTAEEREWISAKPFAAAARVAVLVVVSVAVGGYVSLAHDKTPAAQAVAQVDK